MGTDLNLPSVESRDRARLTRMILVGVAVAALVAGTAMIGGQPSATTAYPDASGYLRGFFQQQDAAGLAAVIDVRGLPNFDPANIESEVGRIVEGGVEVVGEAEATVAGVAIVQVQTTTPVGEIIWCVLPDGTVLPVCRLGELPLTLPEGQGFELDEEFTGGQVFFDGVQLIVGFRLPSDAEPIELMGMPTVTAPADAALELSQPFIGQGQGVPPQPAEGDVTLEPGSTVYFQIIGQDPGLATSLGGDLLTITWGDESFDVAVGRPTWFVK